METLQSGPHGVYVQWIVEKEYQQGPEHAKDQDVEEHLATQRL